MTKCCIAWVDESGKPTPDDNPAVARVRLRPHDVNVHGTRIRVGNDAAWYPICARHLEQYHDMRSKDPEGMAHWEVQMA